MRLGWDRPLYLLAFDHRASFQKHLLGIAGEPTREECARVSDVKALIFEGFLRARAEATLGDGAGILVDEEFGTPVAKRAHESGVVLAMPAEASGRDEFDFEYGADFARHIEAFDPALTKVLVRYNPDGDPAMNERQAARLRCLTDWLHAHGRKLLFELLVPATAEQLEAVDDDRERYDRELRPDLVVRSIVAMQRGGVEPDVWKIEGLDEHADCERVAEHARGDGRDGVVCIVLGRGAGAARVARWLRAAADVPGYCGFAIGRTIWWDPLVGFRDGKLARGDAAHLIATNYLRAVETYRAAAA
jgi:myo-inositol catabolism protein IolC